MQIKRNVFCSVGLSEDTIKGYKIYLSKDTFHYANGKAYDLPTLRPDERTVLNMEKDILP